MNKQNGFTLIEVLIAMLVLAIGLLGLAGLQATSLRNTQSAYNRSLATQLVYDLADRMRANISGVPSYTTGSPVQNTNCKNTNGCSPAQMAQNDLYEWKCAVARGCENDTTPIVAVLPGGVFSLPTVVTVGAAKVYTITVSWSDWDDVTHDVKTVSFTTSFQL